MNRAQRRAVLRRGKKNGGTHGAKLSAVHSNQRLKVLGFLSDVIKACSRGDDFDAFVETIGFAPSSELAEESIPWAWLAHYAIESGGYDVDRADSDVRKLPQFLAQRKAVESGQNA